MPQHRSPLQISIHENGTWNLERAGGIYPTLSHVRLRVAIRGASGKSKALFFRPGRQSAAAPVRIAGAPRRPVRIEWADDAHTAGPAQIGAALEYAFDADLPIFFWRLRAANTGSLPWRMETLSLLETGRDGRVRLHPSQRDVAFFCNGWQSWSFAGTLHAGDWMPGVQLGPVNAPMHAAGGPPAGFGPGKFRSEMFTVLTAGDQERCAVIGFLSQRNQFGAVRVDMDSHGPRALRLECLADDVVVDPGEEIVTDWACWIPASTQEPALDWYLEAVARECGARVPERAPAGWCSWYDFREKVTEEDLRRNVQRASLLKTELPLELIQLDDGYQAATGDWLERNAKFPSPMKALASAIRRKKFLPGLWLAPFIARADSRIVQEHPEWRLNTERGGQATAGLIGLRWSRVLDVTRPETMAYIERVVRTACKEWGFKFLKLDFLYAAAVAGKRWDPKRTRAQALHAALQRIRAAAGNHVFLLGCGCPIGSGIGVFDAMRIGPDVDQRWPPHVWGQRWLARNDPTVPSAFNSLRNILARAPLHRRWWWNDPDCMLVREVHTSLTAPERQTLASAIALTGGMLIFSDDLGALSPESRHMAQSLLPPLSERAVILDGDENLPPELVQQRFSGPIGDWQVIGVFNWTGGKADWALDLAECGLAPDSLVYSFWEEKMLEVNEGLVDVTIPRHGCALLGIHPRGRGPCLAGSSLHVSQGLEIKGWKSQKHGVLISVLLPRKYSGKIIVYAPQGVPTHAAWNGKDIPPQPIREALFAFQISGQGLGKLAIHW
jgi:alpha-galactosidase